MSQSIKRTYQSKQIISSRKIGSSYNLASNQQSAEYQMRGGSPRTKHESRPQASKLQWQGIGKALIYKNGSDLQQLLSHKNILLDLITQFDGKDKVIIQGKQRDDFNKRLMLLEGEIEGLLRRRIMFQSPDYQGGTRQLDYTVLLNEKQNQIIELEKKIQNLEQRMRRRQARQTQLQNEILFLNQQLKRKNGIIEHKDQALSQEVAFSKEMASIIESVRRSSTSRNILADLIIPSLDITDIRASARRVTQSRSSNSDTIKLIRQFENAASREGAKINPESIIQGWIMGLPRDNPIKLKLTQGQKRITQDKRYSEMEDKLALAGEIYRQQLQKVKTQNPGMRIQVDDHIFSILRNSGTSVLRVSDVIQIQKTVQKTVQVPVQDARTKHLIHLLASNYKKLFTKYPKLYDQMDSRLTQFFSQQLIDMIQVDQLDRVVQIIKYVPQVVKVQNVYAYSNDKSRKVEFHLRVLIKALLQEMQKIKARSGVVPEMDQGVLGMIRQEIMDIVDVDDILKVYRVTPKIVEVQKIIQKIVERIIEVPRIVQVQRRVQTPVQVKKYEVVQNTINVPIEVPRFQTLIVEKLIEVPRIQERIVEVPKIIQKIVEVIREVPKIIQVERFIEKTVQVDKFRQIQREVIVPLIEYRNVQLIRQKIVATKQIVEKSIPVNQIIEKIVQVRVQVPKIIEVQKIVQKIVERVQYVPAPDIRNHIEIRYEPVDRIIQKVVPIIQIVQQIIEVPQIIEKIVEVHDIIEKAIQVQVMVEKIVYRDRIKQVQKIVQKPVVEYRTVEKIIERIVQVPLIHEVVRIQRQIVEKPVIQTVERISYRQVQIQKAKIIYQDRIKQVERVINHFVKEPQIVRIVEDRIVPVQKVIERIKTVPLIIQKIIEKLVQVPKVVEVERIVEKIVVVPRVIEKVVEVPQIVEKIVERIQIVNQIIQIQKIVNIPVFQERIVEIDVPRNVYVEVERPVEVIREVLVRDQIYKENTKIQEMISQRVVVQTRQIPRTLQVQKIVTNIVQQPRIIQITRDVIVPVQIQIPVDRIIQKMVPIQVVHREVEQVDKYRDRIVPVKQEVIKVIQVQRKVDNMIIQERFKQVQKIVPYIQDRIVEVQRWREKIVPVERVIQEIKQVKQIIQKVVDRVTYIPKVYEVQRIVQKRVDVSKIIQVEKIVPQIIRVNRYIQNIVEKIIQVPVLIQQLRQIQVQIEKIVVVKTQNTQIKQVDRTIEKQVIIQRLKQVTNNIHLIENTLQIVDRIIERDLDPVLVTQERIIEVPQIIEKIVQKIVIMPQIVQVLKYVHEIAERETLGFAVNSQIGIQERKYKQVGGNLKGQLQLLLVELRKIKATNPSIRVQIQMIENFLGQYQNFLLYPRIHQIIKQQKVQKVVQKDRPVLIPFQSQSNLRLQLSKTMLIQKLISELKSLKQQNPTLKFNSLDDDVNLIFLSQLGGNSKFSPQNLGSQLKEFTNSVQRKFSQMGGWSTDHQFMLNSFLQQRFLMANVVKSSNQTIRKTKAISDKRLEQLRRVKEQKDGMGAALKSLRQILPGILSLAQKQKSKGIQTQIKTIITSMNSMLVGQFFRGEPTRQLGQLVLDARIQSLIREKDDLIVQLKERLRNQGLNKQPSYYQSRLKQLTMQKSKIQSSHSRCPDQKRRYTEQIQVLKIRIRQLELEIQRARVMSPKQSINTRNSITVPYQKRTETRIQISRKSDKSQSDSSSYGVNYNNYRNAEQTSNYDGQQRVNRSSYQVNGKHLMSGSEVGTTSLGYNEARIGSHQYILGAQSRSRGQQENLGYNRMQMSSVTTSGNIVNPANKKYQMYYESKYQVKKQ